ncbi:hypothetical protein JCM16303_004600 [Sporobolomyces ruberrimus]
MLSRTIKRTLLQRIPHARYYSSGSPPPPPRGSFFSASAIYPFILLSAITSLALNLSHQRTARSQETSHLSAQITVLESLVNQLRNDPNRLSDEEVEKELELVGLGRGKGKRVVGGEGDKSGKNETSWGEVLFGKRGKEFEPDKDDTDWEKVFQEADEAEKLKSNPSPSSSQETLPTTVLVAPPPLSPASPPTTSSRNTKEESPRPPQKPKTAAIYL